MTRYISILRGINVGGKRKILMSDLNKLYSDLGFSNIITYIQSGNVIFDVKSMGQIVDIEGKIENAIMKIFGFDVPVIVRTVPELQRSIAINPFLTTQVVEVERLCLTFLKDLPTAEKLDNLNKIDFHPDKFEIIGKDVFIYCNGKYSESKLTNNLIESKLKVGATTRNWKTVSKLFELAKK
jgi:uncharacterized protein (DUF1697 family)